MRYSIPGHEPFDIETIILDLNGTLSVGGNIVDGVKERLKEVKGLGFKAILLTGNTRGDADEIASELGIEWRQAKDGEAKRDLALTLGAETCASIGQGLIDLELTRIVKLGIVVTGQAEGFAVPTLQAAHIGIPTINNALDLFIDPNVLIATWRR